jgi:hypothetical protein
MERVNRIAKAYRSVATATCGWVCMAAVGGGMVGCVGGARDGAGASVGRSGDFLVEVGPAAPLGHVENWHGAVAGCEGHLNGSERFAIATRGHGLVVAVGLDGQVVCVDTVEAVEAELESSGRQDEAAGLDAAYQASVSLGHSRSLGTEGSSRSGDPDPEPNLGAIRARFGSGDPDPEPN